MSAILAPPFCAPLRERKQLLPSFTLQFLRLRCEMPFHHLTDAMHWYPIDPTICDFEDLIVPASDHTTTHSPLLLINQPTHHKRRKNQDIQKLVTRSYILRTKITRGELFAAVVYFSIINLIIQSQFLFRKPNCYWRNSIIAHNWPRANVPLQPWSTRCASTSLILFHEEILQG